MSSDNLLYEVTPFQKNLWEGHKLMDSTAEASERAGRDRYEGFGGFAEGVFHCFFADEPQRVEEVADGLEHFVKLDEEMQKVPEVSDLRDMCMGDDRRAGLAAASMIDTLMSTVTAPDEQLEDPRQDEEAIEYLEHLLTQANKDGDEEYAESLERELGEMIEALGEKRDKAAQAAALMDETEIRTAARKAVKTARKAIEEAEVGAEGYGVGLSEHSGKKERRAVSKKLAGLLANNERARKIAEAGRRLQNFAAQEQRKKVRRGCGERAGSYQGAELDKMLPKELIFACPQLRPLFFKKYAERNLACVRKEDKEKKNKGPIVMLLDSSGSMKSGGADIWAAGVALAFMWIARRQKRSFSLIHFGSKVVRTDRFPADKEMSVEQIFEAVNFFKSSGGTNFVKPLNAGVEQIEKDKAMKDADIVMVTDGRAHVDDQFLKDWEAARARLGFRCYSVLVGGSTNVETNAKFSDEVVHLAEVLRDDKEMHKFFGAV